MNWFYVLKCKGQVSYAADGSSLARATWKEQWAELLPLNKSNDFTGLWFDVSLKILTGEKIILCLLAPIEGWLPELHVPFAPPHHSLFHKPQSLRLTRTHRHTGPRCHRNSGLRMILIKPLIVSVTRCASLIAFRCWTHQHTSKAHIKSTQSSGSSNYNTNFFLFHYIVVKAKSQINKGRRHLQ